MGPWSYVFAGGGAFAATLAAPAPALAHTGLAAGGVGDGLAHPLFGADHLLAMVGVGVLAAVAANRTLTWATPVAFVGGMVLGGALGIAGVPLPGVELAIALSVAAVGVLLAGGFDAFGTKLVPFAAALGVLHGHAHGADLPAGAVPVAYVAGFVAATGALHAIGVATGVAIRSRAAVRTAGGLALTGAGIAFALAL